MANFPSNNSAFPSVRRRQPRRIHHAHLHPCGRWHPRFHSGRAGRCSNPASADQIARFMLGFNWFLILGAFMLVGWLATRTAQTSTSLGMQYFSYGAYVVAEALIFVPLLYIADRKAPGAIDSATLITALGAGGSWWSRIARARISPSCAPS